MDDEGKTADCADWGRFWGRLPPTGLPGGDHQGHEGGHGGTRSTTGDTITKNTVSLKGEPSTATGTKGARAWPAQDRMDDEGKTADCADWGRFWGRLPPTGLPEGDRGKDSQRAAREARAVGSGQRAKPAERPAKPAERPAEPASLPRNLASLRSNPPKPPSFQTSKPPPLASLRHLSPRTGRRDCGIMGRLCGDMCLDAWRRWCLRLSGC